MLGQRRTVDQQLSDIGSTPRFCEAPIKHHRPPRTRVHPSPYPSHYTRDIDPMLGKCWASVVRWTNSFSDIGSTPRFCEAPIKHHRSPRTSIAWLPGRSLGVYGCRTEPSVCSRSGMLYLPARWTLYQPSSRTGLVCLLTNFKHDPFPVLERPGNGLV